MNRYAFAVLSQHAKIHDDLDRIDRRYRDLLQRIEEREILAYRNPRKYEELEALKHELLSIRFLTSPSP